jgi:ASC-1-like (ASCH) protein
MQLISEKNEYKIYKNHRDEPYFSFLKNGQKTIEGRIRKKLYRDIAVNDHIVVFNKKETDSVEVLVKRIAEYSSFKEMLEKEPFKKILPDVDSVKQGIEVYKQFYDSEQEKQFGVVVLEVERI